MAVTLPYVFLRIEDRFWLPASFAYLIMLAGLADGFIRGLRAEDRRGAAVQHETE
jgi:hypothetical protein